MSHEYCPRRPVRSCRVEARARHRRVPRVRELSARPCLPSPNRGNICLSLRSSGGPRDCGTTDTDPAGEGCLGKHTLQFPLHDGIEPGPVDGDPGQLTWDEIDDIEDQCCLHRAERAGSERRAPPTAAEQIGLIAPEWEFRCPRRRGRCNVWLHSVSPTTGAVGNRCRLGSWGTSNSFHVHC